MLKFEIIGQRLVMTSPLVVEGTIDYLTAEFLFHDDDWKGADKWAHFTKTTDTQVVEWDIDIIDDRIDKEAHLNLDDGTWKVFVHGSTTDGTRITTEEAELIVNRTGMRSYGVLEEVPLSDAEQISLVANEAREIAVALREDAEAGKFDGDDGFSPTVDIEKTAAGHRVTITDKEGAKVIEIPDGDDGFSPVVSANAVAGGVELTITDRSGSESIVIRHGEDAVSPVVSVDEIEGGHRVTVTDKDGTESFDVLDGISSKVQVVKVDGGYRVFITHAGKMQQFHVYDGADGVSPVVSVAAIAGGHRVTITDKDGSNVFDVMNGGKGDRGDAGVSPTISTQEVADGINVNITDSTHTETIKLKNGADGISPTVETAAFDGGHKVLITDETGTKTFDVHDGKDGRDGSMAIPAPTKFVQSTKPSDLTGSIGQIVYGNGRFVISSSGPAVFVTSDFVSFRKIDLTEGFTKLKFAGGYFFLVGKGQNGIDNIFGNTLRYSIDGEKWTEVTLPASTVWTDIDYGNGYYVLISGEYGGDESNISAYSTDLTNWTQVELPASDAWMAIRYGGGWFVAITYTGTHLAVFPPSNLKWTDAGAFGKDLYFELYHYNNNFYIPVCPGGIGASTNEIIVGNPWEMERKQLPIAAHWQCMAFGAGYAVCFAHSVEGFTNIQDACYSVDDGETWEHVEMPILRKRYNAAFGNMTFACTGSDGKLEICKLWDSL